MGLIERWTRHRYWRNRLEEANKEVPPEKFDQVAHKTKEIITAAFSVAKKIDEDVTTLVDASLNKHANGDYAVGDITEKSRELEDENLFGMSAFSTTAHERLAAFAKKHLKSMGLVQKSSVEFIAMLTSRYSQRHYAMRAVAQKIGGYIDSYVAEHKSEWIEEEAIKRRMRQLHTDHDQRQREFQMRLDQEADIIRAENESRTTHPTVPEERVEEIKNDVFPEEGWQR